MSSQNVEAVRRGIEAFNLGDYDAALGFADPQIEWHDAPDMPDAGTHRGRDAVRKRWEAMREALEGFYAKPERFFDADDQVVVFLRVGGTGRESGVPVDRSVAHVWTLRNGKGIRVDVHSDRATALEAVGIRDESTGDSSATSASL
jgi:ketosteroid isomerase-like protein